MTADCHIDWNAKALEFMRRNNVCPQATVLQVLAKAMQEAYEEGAVEYIKEAIKKIAAADVELQRRRAKNFTP